MFDSKMHGGKYRKRPSLWSFAYKSSETGSDWLQDRLKYETIVTWSSLDRDQLLRKPIYCNFWPKIQIDFFFIPNLDS